MADLASLVARLEAVAARLESSTKGGAAPVAAAAAAPSGASSASVDGFDEIINGSLKAFTDLSTAVGGDVAAVGALVNKAFVAQRAMVELASKSKKPSDADLPAILADTSAAIVEIQNFREANRRSTQGNHLAAVSEGIPALGWVTVSPKPAPFVKEMKDAAAFYFNRVLKDFKETDKQQCDWAKAFGALLDELADYVKRVHTTGLVWNQNGGDAKAAAASAPKPAAAPAAAPAAPKPAAAAAGAPDGAAKSSLFAALSAGDGVTSGLKKVDKSEMTHKNPALRASSVVPAGTAPAGAAAPKAAAAKTEVKKDPVFELQGKKWVVEHHSGNPNIVIDDCNLKQNVYIYKCDNSTIQIKNKVNSISIDSCKKVALVFESALATCEIVNSQSLQVQVLGTCPTVSVDKTDGFQLYLSEASLETQVVTAKSSEMNILIPGGPDGDMIELPVPEQYKTVVKGQKLHTEISEIAG